MSMMKRLLQEEILEADWNMMKRLLQEEILEADWNMMKRLLQEAPVEARHTAPDALKSGVCSK